MVAQTGNRPDKPSVIFQELTRETSNMEEDTAEPKPQGLRHRWKRGLILALLLSVLLFSLFYYVVIPRVFVKALRRDSIPSNAYIVPWMRPNPSISSLNPQIPGSPPPWDIDTIMSDALKLDITFRITVPYETRIVPSTIYIGHDSTHLYVGGRFNGMRSNPISTFSNLTRPNYFAVFLDVTNDGVLSFPESGSRLSAFIEIPRLTGALFHHDMTWAYSNMFMGSSRWAWVMTDNYYEQDLQKTQPGSTMAEMIHAYDNSTGTLIVLFSKFLSKPVTQEFNALQMQPGERWVMGFLLELGYATNGVYPYDFVDGWPRNIYPYLSNDASWWPKLVIDLANPPANM